MTQPGPARSCCVFFISNHPAVTGFSKSYNLWTKATQTRHKPKHRRLKKKIVTNIFRLCTFQNFSCVCATLLQKVTSSRLNTGFLKLNHGLNKLLTTAQTDWDQRSCRGPSLSGLDYREGVSIGCWRWRCPLYELYCTFEIALGKKNQTAVLCFRRLDTKRVNVEQGEEGRSFRNFLLLKDIFFAFSPPFLFLNIVFLFYLILPSSESPPSTARPGVLWTH